MQLHSMTTNWNDRNAKIPVNLGTSRTRWDIPSDRYYKPVQVGRKRTSFDPKSSVQNLPKGGYVRVSWTRKTDQGVMLVETEPTVHQFEIVFFRYSDVRPSNQVTGESCVPQKISNYIVVEECSPRIADLESWWPYSQSPFERTSLLSRLRAAQKRFNEEKSAILRNFSLETGKEQTFLSRHLFLYPVLSEAKKHIEEYFGDVPVSLRLYKYHDQPFEEQLIIYIHTSLEVAEAMTILDALFQEWWFDMQDRTKGKIGLDLRFQ